MKKSLLVLFAALAAFSQTSRIIPTFPYGVSYDEGGTITPDTVNAAKGDFDSLTVNDLLRLPYIDNGEILQTVDDEVVGLGGVSGCVPVKSDVGGADLYSIASNGTRLITTGWRYSNDSGATWTTAVPGFPQTPTGVAWNGARFIAVGTEGKIARSSDGITWDSLTSGTSANLNAASWDSTNSQLVIVGSSASSDGTVLTCSDDLSSCTERTYGTNASVRGVVSADTIIVTAATGGNVKTSPDGVTWTGRNPQQGTTEMYGVTWSGTTYVVVGDAGAISTSPTSVTWTARTSGTAEDFLGVFWTGTRLIAIGRNGTIRISDDEGVTWDSVYSGTTADLYGITQQGGSIFVVGETGTTLQSDDDGDTWDDFVNPQFVCTNFDTLAATWLRNSSNKTANVDSLSARVVTAELVDVDSGAFESLSCQNCFFSDTLNNIRDSVIAINLEGVRTDNLITKGPWVDIRFFGAVGDSATDNTDAIIDAQASANGRNILVPAGVYRVSTACTLSGAWTFLSGASLLPDSGVTITGGSTLIITALNEWKDVSEGGSFAFLSGAWERRTVKSTSGVTSGTIYNVGFPGNSIGANSGTSNVFGGTASFPQSIGIASELSTINGCYDNSIGDTSAASNIAGGCHHIVGNNSGHSGFLAGAYGRSYASYAGAGVGRDNTVWANYGWIGGGQSNVVGDSAAAKDDSRSAVVGGGANNRATKLRSGVFSGFTNTATDTSAVVTGGASNNATAPYSGVLGGFTNNATGRTSGVGNGSLNTASGTASWATGETCTASGTYAHCMAEFGLAGGSRAHATGSRSSAPLHGQKAHAGGYFAARGDAQMSDVVMRTSTTGAQTKNLDLNGATTNRLAIPANTTWAFKITVAARNVTSDGEDGAWTYVGAVKRDGTAASTTLLAAATETIIFAPSGYTIAVTADTTNGALQISVTSPEASDVVYWVGRIELTEVGG